MAKVFVSQRIHDEAVELLRDAGHEVNLRAEDSPPAPEELRKSVQGHEALLCMLTDTIDEALFEANPQLQIVANIAVGTDNVDVDAAARHGVAVTNTPDVLTDATADLAFGLLLAAARRIPEGDAYLRAGRYRQWTLFQEQTGLQVHGATLGVVGMGRIGQAVARRGRFGFDMRVLYYDPAPLDPKREHSLDVHPVAFEELLERADFISVHVPLVEGTHHLFDAQALARMKPSAVLINTARGPIIDEEALVEALRGGRIAGAGLDVFEDEPDVHPGLIDLHERVVLLPHLGSATVETRLQMALLAAENVREGLAGRQPPTLVNA